jgi:hypothetical protein
MSRRRMALCRKLLAASEEAGLPYSGIQVNFKMALL